MDGSQFSKLLNKITFIGFVIEFISFILIINQAPNLKGPIPSYLILYAGISHFIYFVNKFFIDT